MSASIKTHSSQQASTTGNTRKSGKLNLVLNPGGLPTTGENPSVQNYNKRGIFKTWSSDNELASQTSLYLDTIQLISNLATTSITILNDNLFATSLKLRSPSISSISFLHHEGNNLGAIAARIQYLEKKGVDLEFETAINLIQFALKLDILQDERKEDFSALIRKEITGGGLVGCSEFQGKRWRAWGTRLVEFVGASKSLF
jgi:hypothetical protein